MSMNSAKIETFPVLSELDSNFVNQIKMFSVFGSNSTLALYVMLDDTVYATELTKTLSNTKQPKLIKEVCDKSIIKFDSGCSEFVLTLSMNGAVYSWGRNKCGQLGVGDTCDRINPEMINGLSDVIDVCCGSHHSLALTFSGEVYAFGSNSFGQIGNGSHGNQLIPTKLNSFEDEKLIAISCGLEHSLALTGTGRVYGWGSNQFRQLCAQTTGNLLVPKLISSDLPFINKIKCGRYNSLLLSCECELFILGSTEISRPNAKIVRDRDKFLDIGASIHSEIFVGITVKFEGVVWNENFNKIYICESPQECNISVNEAFAAYSRSVLTLNNVWLVDNCLIRQKYDQFLAKHDLLKYKIKFNELKIFNGGAFGTIAKVISRSDCKIYSIKKLLRETHNTSSKKMDREVEIIKQIECDNIVTYFDITSETIDSDRSMIFIQMEFCSLTLTDVIKEMHQISYKNKFNDDVKFELFSYVIASHIFTEILDGIHYLHTHSPPIIHRNLTSDNILITNSYGTKLIKICSFSLATFHEFEDQSHTAFVGLLGVRAPEVSISRKYDTKSDMYSLGLLMQKLFNIDINISSYTIEFLKSIFEYNANMYLNARRYLIKLLSPQAMNRPSCEEMLRDKSWTFSYDKIKYEYSYNDLINKTDAKSFFRYFVETKLYRTNGNGNDAQHNIISSNIIASIAPYSDKQKSPVNHYSGFNSNLLTPLMKDEYNNKFIELKQIGSGGYGAVYKCLNKWDNKIYAVKKIPILDSNDSVRDALNELEFLSQLKSEFVVQYVDHWIENNYYTNIPINDTLSGDTKLFDPHKPKLLHLLMELCSHTLKNVIDDLSNPLKEFTDPKTRALTPIGYYISSELFIEILECVNYIHKQIPPILHRDLKPDNILLSHWSNGRFVKLADFGLATVHTSDGNSHTKFAGTAKFMAPEVATGRAYDTKADIYSLGMIAQLLFMIDINKPIYKSIDSTLNGKIEFMFQLINKLLLPKTSDRPDCDQMLSEKNMWSLSIEELKIISDVEKITASLSHVNLNSENFCNIFLISKIKDSKYF